MEQHMSDYRLGPCIVLVAAVRGTREAYDAAMEMLPVAANSDDRPAAQGARAKFAVREYKVPQELQRKHVLSWAKQLGKTRMLPGVLPQ